ncbi:MAG TPA: cation diffusion facilitator family transporter, partial [Candidatus Kryptobacter bacterium]|nr:cation diffusion facilitator family transporter [Candidatus Kryptobacter bacterium]
GGSSLVHLAWAGILNIAIAVVEFVGGLFSGSLSIMSDALHNFTDAGSVGVSIVALRLNEKPKDLNHTFGLKRAQIIAAIFNSVVLILISLFLMKEAVMHLAHSTHVEAGVMMIVGGFGLVANVAGTLLLHRDAADNINIRSSYLHLLADSMSSAAVIVGGLFIYLFNAYWIDPLLTFAISMYVLREGWEITKESVEIIMMVTPASVDIKEIQAAIEGMPAVRNVHHVHSWVQSEHDLHFEAHVEVDQNVSVAETTKLQREIAGSLAQDFGINHVTLQFECGLCGTKALV